MNNLTKGKSPFYPGQPVPVELFTGRNKEIQRIARSIQQVELGKPQAVFLTGEYGIGKSSLAGFMEYYAEHKNNILGIYVLLGGVSTLDELATKSVEAAIKSGIYQPSISEKIKNFFAKYIGKQELFGMININFEALKKDGPDISRGYLPFLKELYSRVKDAGTKGLMLIFDEINGITDNPQLGDIL